MSTWRQILYGIALLLALALLFQTQHQRIELARKDSALARQNAAAAQAEAVRSAAVARAVSSALVDERAAQIGLRNLQDELRTALARRQQTIKELTRENNDLRRWSEQLLPDAAAGLRQRPALIGASAYRDWVSSGRTVPTAGDSAGP